MLKKHSIKAFGKISLHCTWKKKKKIKTSISTGINKTKKFTVNWAKSNYLESIRKHLHAANNSYFIAGFLLCFRPPRHVRTYSNNLWIIFIGSDIQLVNGKFLCNNKIFYTYFRDGRTNLKSLFIRSKSELAHFFFELWKFTSPEDSLNKNIVLCAYQLF